MMIVTRVIFLIPLKRIWGNSDSIIPNIPGNDPLPGASKTDWPSHCLVSIDQSPYFPATDVNMFDPLWSMILYVSNDHSEWWWPRPREKHLGGYVTWNWYGRFIKATIPILYIISKRILTRKALKCVWNTLRQISQEKNNSFHKQGNFVSKSSNNINQQAREEIQRYQSEVMHVLSP